MKYQKLKIYKYILAEDYVIQIPIIGILIEHEFLSLSLEGVLTIYKGYLWDGVSGPTWDTKTTMTPGLVHDALYQAIRLCLLNPRFKESIDSLFYTLMLKEGVWTIRAGYFYQAVLHFGGSSCIPGDFHIPKTIEV